MTCGSLLTLLLAAAVSAGTPILLAGLGELIAEKAGVLNLGVEGMMLVGALTAFAVAAATGSPWAGATAAAVVTGVFALLHALPVVLLGVDPVVSGLALVLLGSGLSASFGRPFIGQPATAFSDLPLPGLSGLPGIGPVLFTHDPLVTLGLLLVPGVALWLRSTRPGLLLRICGENPQLADAQGHPVLWYRIGATVAGGVLAGLGGAALSLAETPSWVDGLAAGRGWIALALVVFAGWSPWRLLLGAWLVGGVGAVGFRAQAFGLDLPSYGLKLLPYLATLLVLVFASTGRLRRHLGAPAALGRPYSRERRE